MLRGAAVAESKTLESKEAKEGAGSALKLPGKAKGRKISDDHQSRDDCESEKRGRSPSRK